VPRKQEGGRKSDIADAILKIAGREGIGALTMERLARELGVTSGALFRHFPSRTSMLNEAARLAVTRLEATFPPASLPPLERLRSSWWRARDWIGEAFRHALGVRALGAEARALADRFFFETLVRVHREGEGAPYTGLKPAGTAVDPAIAASDTALETGSVDPLVKLLTAEVDRGLRHRFAEAAPLTYCPTRSWAPRRWSRPGSGPPS